MPFDAATRQKIDDWMNAKCITFLCPCCTNSKWHADRFVGALDLGWSVGPVNLAAVAVQPFLAVVCGDCGYTIFFSAQMMGLTP